MERFAPGDLVHARGREWIALPSPETDWLCLRPLSGAESDALLLDPALEREPIRPARFDLPEFSDTATQDAARLLSDALHLSMRRGAGGCDSTLCGVWSGFGERGKRDYGDDETE